MRIISSFFLFSLTLLSLATCGCTDAERSSIAAYGAEHSVELWSGGQKVREWTSTGKVFSEENSDGYYFMDKKTGKQVLVTGDLVITPIE